MVRFSDGIRVDSLQRGVVEIQVIEGGAGRNADTWYMGGKFEEPDEGGSSPSTSATGRRPARRCRTVTG